MLTLTQVLTLNSINWQSGYIAYVNGIEVDRANMGPWVLLAHLDRVEMVENLG